MQFELFSVCSPEKLEYQRIRNLKRVEYSKKYNKAYIGNRIAEGKCIGCGSVPVPGIQRCAQCRDYLAEKRKELLSIGVCPMHGQALLPGFKSKCAKCINVRRFKKFHVSQETYEKMLRDQNYSCAICRKPFIKETYIDHDHSCCSGDKSCGKCIRGLLCIFCNSGLGFFKDNLESLDTASQYIRNSKIMLDIKERTC